MCRGMKLERRGRGLSTFCPLQSFCLHPSSPLFSFLLAMPFNIPSPKHLSVFFLYLPPFLFPFIIPLFTSGFLPIFSIFFSPSSSSINLPSKHTPLLSFFFFYPSPLLFHLSICHSTSLSHPYISLPLTPPSLLLLA